MIATIKPNTVVNSATFIPPATNEGEMSPAASIAQRKGGGASCAGGG